MEEKKGSNIWKRVRIYLVGVGIGSLISFVFFKGRGCDAWMPTNRVTEMLNQNAIIANDTILCKMKNNKIGIGDIKQLMIDGEVNFSESKTKGNPQIYVLEGENVVGEKYKAYFQTWKTGHDHDTISYLIGITGRPANCSNSDNKLIHLSQRHIGKIVNTDDTLKFVDIAPQQMESFHLLKDSVLYGIAEGKLNTSHTNPELKPRALFVFNAVIQKEKYRVSFTKNGGIIEIMDIRKTDF